WRSLGHGRGTRSQRGVCVICLRRRTGPFAPEGEGERRECLRRIICDKQKVRGFFGPYRFLRRSAPAPDPAADALLQGRLATHRGIVDQRLAKTPYRLGANPAIADISLAGYMYYPPEEFGFDIAKDYSAIGAWADRVKALPGWQQPYELMPGYPLAKV